MTAIGCLTGIVRPVAETTADSLWGFILSLSKNEAFAAFLGAAFAFALVMLNDWRRQHRRAIKTLPGRIAFARLVAAERLAMIDKALAEQNFVATMPTRYMRSPLIGIRELAADVNELLTPQQRLAVESACFMLESLDAHLVHLERMAQAYFANHKQLVPTTDQARTDIRDFRAAMTEARDLAQFAVSTCDKYPNQ